MFKSLTAEIFIMNAVDPISEPLFYRSICNAFMFWKSRRVLLFCESKNLYIMSCTTLCINPGIVFQYLEQGLISKCTCLRKHVKKYLSCSSLNYHWMCCRIWERRTPVWPALLFLPRTTQHIRRMVPSINRGCLTSSHCMRYTIQPV